MHSASNSGDVLQRVTQLFRFLQAYNQVRNPIRYSIKEYRWRCWFYELPDHPCVRRPVPNGPEDSEGDLVVRVSRPELTLPPEPPVSLADWLQPGWESIDAEPAVTPVRPQRAPDGAGLEIRFEADPRRVQDWQTWKELRRQWQEQERPAYAAFRLFENLYALYAELQRESERLELVLGDGILNWQRSPFSVHHPLLIQRLQLQFIPATPEFVLRTTEQPAEFYTALFQTMDDVDGRIIAQARQEWEDSFPEDISDETALTFLRNLTARLSAKGRFVEGEPAGFETSPRIGCSPVIFLRERATGYADAIESILTGLPENSALPVSLRRIVGVDAEPTPADLPDTSVVQSQTPWGTSDVLLSKPANTEQIQIAQRLAKHRCVLVQGPPGTGKTHTIANLIGHLLAQGKTILVTSYSTKALRVLREQVVPPLQPLCVSVLDSDAESRGLLEGSVAAIVERLSKNTAAELQAEADRLRLRRNILLDDLTECEQALLQARGAEYRPIVVNGQEFSPSDAARQIAAGTGREDWIPLPVLPGSALPLTLNEFAELYASNAHIDAEEERELSGSLPSLSDLPSPETWQNWLEDRTRLLEQVKTDAKDQWATGTSEQRTETLEQILQQMESLSLTLASAEDWELELVAVGEQPERRALWDDLLELIKTAGQKSLQAERALIEHEPALDCALPLDEQSRLFDEIYAHLESGQKLGFMTLLMKPAWKRLLQSAAVKNRTPETTEDIAALQAVVRLSLTRTELVRRWKRQVTAIGGPALTTDAPEKAALRYVETFPIHLGAMQSQWNPIETGLTQAGFQWNVYFQTRRSRGKWNSIRELRDEVLPELLQVVRSRTAVTRLHTIHEQIRQLTELLEPYGSASKLISELRSGVNRLDATAYRAPYRELADLIAQHEAYVRRCALLRRLDSVAPGWAAAIQQRQSPHQAAQLPGNVEQAWIWRQLVQELETRDTASPENLERKRDRMTRELREATAQLVENLAWSAQIARTSLKQRQSLMGWLGLVKKMGKGKGKRVPLLQKEARLKMQEARSAVPVWIMPISRLVENFDAGAAHFDVVIVDEASQADAMGLIPLYMADSVVVVGDNEQVSPDAVGERIDRTQHLIDEHLHGIPNAVLYDGQRSLYDIAHEAFDGNICLTEHFRCAPEIIQFSNALCYDYKIKPLRDTSAVPRKPAVVPIRVQAVSSSSSPSPRPKTNRTEALTIVSLLLAAIEQPEYADATFGVISLVGNEQARLIETLLRQRIPPDEMEKRRILCGTPPQFQGDERDVMFLSLVDMPGNGPLTLRQEGAHEMYKKRYNVAASRARDQMWVVYSLNPGMDLQTGDIRRRLIEHALDPAASLRAYEDAGRPAESEFERQVIRRLVDRGYRVTSQYSVGAFRIDIVVEDGDGRLAIECDGDRYHTMENLAEDMARQAILERLGWRFARIRGSEFFRAPDQAMKPVFDWLDSLDIQPASETTPSAADDSSEVLLRIKTRAAALCAEWDEPPPGAGNGKFNFAPDADLARASSLFDEAEP